MSRRFPSETAIRLTERLRDGVLPTIVAGDPFPGVPCVTVDDAAGSRLSAHHLFERGHRHCLYASCGPIPLSGARRQLVREKLTAILVPFAFRRPLNLRPAAAAMSLRAKISRQLFEAHAGWV